MRSPRDLLPVPDEDALAASQRASQRIAERIDAAGGWIAFDEYMQLALYEPELGYYTGGSSKIGPAGDFVTAPALSALFGSCVATQIARWLDPDAPRIVEFGAGTGTLAAQVLNELEQLGHKDTRYDILELSGELVARQEETLRKLAPRAFERVRWLEALPESIEGVVLANEVLDAIPVRLFHARQGRIFERGVVLHASASARAGIVFNWGDRPADADLIEAASLRLNELRVGAARADAAPGTVEGMALDYLSEYHEQAIVWTAELANRLKRGAMLLIDYGFPAREYYHPQRNRGTLMCHYRHRAHADPFFLPGLQDITAHCDFSAIASAGQSAGLEVIGYTNQANFLINCGLLDHLGAIPVDQTLAYAKQAHAVQQLVSEAEMGELFKVLALGRGLSNDAQGNDLPGQDAADNGAIGFVRGDRRASL